MRSIFLYRYNKATSSRQVFLFLKPFIIEHTFIKKESYWSVMSFVDDGRMEAICRRCYLSLGGVFCRPQSVRSFNLLSLCPIPLGICRLGQFFDWHSASFGWFGYPFFSRVYLVSSRGRCALLRDHSSHSFNEESLDKGRATVYNS